MNYGIRRCSRPRRASTGSSGSAPARLLAPTSSGHELINRANVGPTVRVWGPHALSIGYLISTRDARIPAGGDRHQSVQTVTLPYDFLGHTRFGAVEWCPDEMPAR